MTHIITKLLDTKDVFPDMRWDVSDAVVTITIPVTFEEQEFLLDARRMFEPS